MNEKQTLDSEAERLGRVLAYIRIAMRNGGESDLTNLNADDRKTFVTLGEICTGLKREQSFRSIFQALPSHECRNNSTFVENNLEFYAAVLASQNQIDVKWKRDVDAIKIFTHLNECFACNEQYATVMRSYSRQLLFFANGGKEE